MFHSIDILPMGPKSVASPLGLSKTVSWIHDTATSPELLAMVQEIHRDVVAGRRPQFLIASDGSQLTAAAYFRVLCGNVATLGGMRAAPGYEQQCIDLLTELTGQLVNDDIFIQAIVDESNSSQGEMLLHSGYEQHAEVKQLWLELANDMRPRYQMPKTHSWRPATGLSRNKLLDVLHSTFVDTLDCPVLNELRTPEDVLAGFQDGREFAHIENWFLLHQGSIQTDVGCLLLAQHSPMVVELDYMGLKPVVRGQQLGSTLIDKAITTSKKLGADLLVTGVDNKNWPALRAYYEHGFQVHASKSVYFRSADVRATTVPARDGLGLDRAA